MINQKTIMENKTLITREKLFDLYGDDILSHGERPRNVYLFAKKHGLEEKDFYDYFSGFEHMEREMLEHLFSKSIELTQKVEHREAGTAKGVLLNLYFIFFENLTMNRSLVLMILGRDFMPGTKVLYSLRETHRKLVRTLNFNDYDLPGKTGENFRNLNEKAREEVLWLHLVSCLEFWRKDTSPAFEKTDIYIEKTIDTGFELADNEPVRKAIDLGKFLWKETFRKH